MKKHLAIICASYLQLPLIEKAKDMGYTTHVFAWAAGDVGEEAADFFYPVSIVEKEEILDKCRQIGICGICSKDGERPPSTSCSLQLLRTGQVPQARSPAFWISIASSMGYASHSRSNCSAWAMALDANSSRTWAKPVSPLR